MLQVDFIDRFQFDGIYTQLLGHANAPITSYNILYLGGHHFVGVLYAKEPGKATKVSSQSLLWMYADSACWISLWACITTVAYSVKSSSQKQHFELRPGINLKHPHMWFYHVLSPFSDLYPTKIPIESYQPLKRQNTMSRIQVMMAMLPSGIFQKPQLFRSFWGLLSITLRHNEYHDI